MHVTRSVRVDWSKEFTADDILSEQDWGRNERVAYTRKINASDSVLVGLMQKIWEL